MGDGIKFLLNSMCKGFKDSIVGMLKVYHLDEDIQAEDDDGKEAKEPETNLARRRAERLKTSQPAVKKESQPKVFQRILLCCAWNGGIFWLSILLFNGLLIPGLELLMFAILGDSSTYHVVWSYTGRFLSWTFGALWILPLFVLSKVVNAFWFQDIADAAYRKSRGRPQLLPGLSKIIADIVFSLLLQSLFLIQGMLVKLLPIQGIGDLVHLIHMCLLYSLYAFEYKWFNMGWEVHKRLSYIESNWPYFVGFGLPLAVLTSLPSSFIISGCVFSILFPLFIVSGNEAEPLQQPFDFPLRLFSPVVAVSNVVFRHSVKTPPVVSGSSSPGPTGKVGPGSGAGQTTTASPQGVRSKGATKRVTLQEHAK